MTRHKLVLLGLLGLTLAARPMPAAAPPARGVDEDRRRALDGLMQQITQQVVGTVSSRKF